MVLLLAAVAVATVAAGRGMTERTDAQGVGCAVNPAELSIDAEEQGALDAINALRSAAGLATLSPSPALGQAAAHKSATMAATGFFAHDDPGRTWLQRVQECGYRASPLVWENLAEGTDTGRATVQLWRDSPPHNQAIMNSSLRAVGIARVRAGGGAWYWTADFGAAVEGGSTSPTSPATTSAPPAPVTAPAPSIATSPGGLQVGGLATVSAGRGDCLNVRFTPGRTAPIAGCVPDGAVVRVAGGPQTSDGASWWLLDGLGWASGEFLVPGGSGAALLSSLAAVLRLPPLDEDPCLPPAGAAACDSLRLALWLGDPDAWAAWQIG